MLNANKFDSLPVVSYASVRDSFVDGDILLFEGTSLLDNFIQQGTNSRYSHCSMCFWWNSRLLVLESIINFGVRALPLSDYINEYTGRIRVGRHKEMTLKQSLPILSMATNYLGHPYGTDEILDILGHVLIGINNYHGTDAIICSEYIARCFEAGGISIPSDSGGYWFPRTIANDPGLDPLFELGR